MKVLIQLCLLISIPTLLTGQDFQDEFQKCCEKQDAVCQLETLQKWEQENPSDPELFTSYFNYHFLKSRESVIALTAEEPDDQGLVIKSENGQATEFFIGSDFHYDRKEVQKGIDMINKGIEQYPNRLDMRFGKIYVYGQIEDWETFTDEIITTVKYSATNQNKWTWTNNQEKEGGEESFLSAIQDYQLKLYDTGSDDLLLNMRRIANAVLESYPNHVESLSNLSITYIILGEPEKSIEPLLRAEKINPSDHIVLINIAHGYKLIGNKDQSIAYYEKVLLHGNEEAKQFAKQQIEILKK